MNTALNIYALPHSAAADAYADELGREQLKDDAIQLCIDDRAAEIERIIRKGDSYRGHSYTSLFGNADDASNARMCKIMAAMVGESNRGIDSIAAAFFVGSLEAEVRIQARQIATEEVRIQARQIATEEIDV